jgi:glycopeptide antibiotics resistance protein
MAAESPSYVSVLPIGIVVLIVVVVMLWRKKPSLSYLLCFAVFSLYIVIVIDKTLLPIEISGGYADVMRREPFMSSVNYIPFYFGPFGTLESSLNTLLLNVALMIPFGFGVNFIAPVKPKHMLWLAPVVGLSIETTQLIISLLLRYAYRIIDINDVLMNTLGVVIGYALFRVFAWLYLWTFHKLGIKGWGLAAYLYEVARQANHLEG